MTISKGTEAKILRYHFVEKWRVGTIATQLGIHYGVVDRVLSQAGLPKIERSPRPSIIDPIFPLSLKPLMSSHRSPPLVYTRWPNNGGLAVAPVSFVNASVSYDPVNSPKLIYV